MSDETDFTGDEQPSEEHAPLRGGAPVPQGPLPLLPLRSGYLFPTNDQTFNVGRLKSVTLVESIHVGDVVGIVTQHNAKLNEPRLHDLWSVGTFARVVSIAQSGSRSYQVTVEGIGRFQLTNLAQTEPYLRGFVEVLSEGDVESTEVKLLAEELSNQLQRLTAEGVAGGDLPAYEGDASSYADRVAAQLQLDSEQAEELLGIGDTGERLRRLLGILGHLSTRAKIKEKIAGDVRKQFGKQQREAVLREQLKVIQRELDGDESGEEDSLQEKLEALEFPEDVRKVVKRELKRLRNAGNSPESNVIRTYLDWIAALPWEARADEEVEISEIERQLDADHFGLEDVKKRILEHMAVRKLTGNKKGTILALHGPPGVGKTSLGQSVAEATGRPLVRIALGGVRDEAEVRGHRRTYVGALPGRILHALRKAKVKNPVVLLDEIDKLGTGWGGSPEAALLEVLDPEQNKNFTDHYLELPFDLSEVMFIATANSLEPLSAPLRDRLELVEVSGYTELEKLEIARRHLIPKRVEESGLPSGAVNILDSALQRLTSEYTREAGVRQLEREIGRVTRQLALSVARAKDEPVQITVDRDNVEDYLGKPKYRNDVAERTALPGVATGLAWTPVGGDILFIETTSMPGKGKIEITGKLGDVMKESARAALSYVRSHALELGLDSKLLDTSDLHLHVPAGAVPKDGPSAGVTIFTALTSLLSNRRVRSDTAMTGECSLRGRVLPVGGIKSKVMAAHRAGITRVVLPEGNRRDYDDVPQSVRDELEVIFATEMHEVLEATLQDSLVINESLITGGEQRRATSI